MATTQSNNAYRRKLDFKYWAEWRAVDVDPVYNAATKDFGPASALKAGQSEPALGLPYRKHVVYMPVKRQKKRETVPSLGIHIAFWEAGSFENVSVTEHRGAAVKVAVFNVWGGQEKGPVAFEGRLDDRGRCFIKIPSPTVKDWLDPEKGKALGGRINELLLDFSFEFPDLKIDGQQLKGQSVNRLFLYRRKVIVFLPGVFGSQVKVKMPDGRTLGFPDFYDENVSGPDVASWLAGQGWAFMHQKVGGLECDAAGEPLVRPIKPTLLRLTRGLKIYDTFNQCRAARMRYFAGVPEEFRLVELQLHSYDWRGDLTEAAKKLVETLKDLQDGARKDALRKLPDVDDEVAVAGHSTGGVIIRRALKEPGMEDLVSHAFFLNVPFRGAPKALGVILTGEDPPGGKRMIPFIDAHSLRATALSMPIVYHLAPSGAYPERVAHTYNRPPSVARDTEADKRDLVASAIASQFMAPPRFIKASGLTADERGWLAAGADRWHGYWAEAFERFRAHPAYAALYAQGYPRHDDWFDHELEARGLRTQYDARTVGGWNEELAGRAKRFHEESEELARSGAWKDKSFVFYSVAEARTTLRVHFELASQNDYPNAVALLDAEGIAMNSFYGGGIVPARSEEKQRMADGHEVPALFAHQWVAGDGGRTRRLIWKVYGETVPNSGDGTVPLRSLLGFGGPATVFAAIPEGPEHIDAPNKAFVWDGIMHALQGTIPDRMLDKAADTSKGTTEAQ